MTEHRRLSDDNTGIRIDDEDKLRMLLRLCRLGILDLGATSWEVCPDTWDVFGIQSMDDVVETFILSSTDESPLIMKILIFGFIF